MANTADAVVIGGGINGTNTAWWLARRKVGKVILLEKSHSVGSQRQERGARRFALRNRNQGPTCAQGDGNAEEFQRRVRG
jgi:glycine/D-amino acid oxidase-like deaminating enzyme